MDGQKDAKDDSPIPPPTWGSTMIVSSGSSSILSTHPNPTPPIRVLDMHATPDGPFSRNSIRRGDVEGQEVSSPVEEFSSPAKPSQISEEWSFPSEQMLSQNGTGSGGSGEGDIHDTSVSNVRVGIWEVPNVREREAVQVDIDPNGDDDQVNEQVARFIASENNSKRKRTDREEAVTSSMPSQMSDVGIDFTPTKIPHQSTPPPKRSRRGQRETQSPANLPTSPPRTVSQEKSINSDKVATIRTPTDLASIPTIIDKPHDDSSRQAIIHYSQTSPLIPDFLKEEIRNCISRAEENHLSQSNKSDSDTQEDGYLKTKPFWIFEILRISASDDVLAGDQLTSGIQVDDRTLVLHIYSNGMSYGVQMVGREHLMMSRNELRTNPWFDSHGHPFSIIYQRQPALNNTSNESSLITQASAEQVSLLQNEIEQLQEEKRIALRDKVEAERKWQAALASNEASQESNDFLKEQYSLASNMAAESAKEVGELRDQVTSLQSKLSEGMKSVQAFSKQRLDTLQSKLKVTESQLNLLKQQNRLTDDSVREKASLWDTYQAKEESRLKELEKRRAEVSVERAALYQSMQEEEARRAIDARRPAHEHFLEVDLLKQKESLLAPQNADIADGEEDEVAMLKAEAEEAMGGGGVEGTIDDSTSRGRAARGNDSTLQSERKDSNVAEVIANSQAQAEVEVAEALQDELNYHSSALDLS